MRKRSILLMLLLMTALSITAARKPVKKTVSPIQVTDLPTRLAH